MKLLLFNIQALHSVSICHMPHCDVNMHFQTSKAMGTLLWLLQVWQTSISSCSTK